MRTMHVMRIFLANVKVNSSGQAPGLNVQPNEKRTTSCSFYQTVTTVPLYTVVVECIRTVLYCICEASHSTIMATFLLRVVGSSTH